MPEHPIHFRAQLSGVGYVDYKGRRCAEFALMVPENADVKRLMHHLGQEFSILLLPDVDRTPRSLFSNEPAEEAAAPASVPQ